MENAKYRWFLAAAGALAITVLTAANFSLGAWNAFNPDGQNVAEQMLKPVVQSADNPDKEQLVSLESEVVQLKMQLNALNRELANAKSKNGEAGTR